MQAQRLRHHDRLQEVALELVDRDDDDDDDEGDDRPVRNECDEGGERTRGRRSDERDERADEDDDRERQGERHPEDREADADRDGVDEGDDRRAAHVTAQRGDGGDADAFASGPPRRREVAGRRPRCGRRPS